MGEMTGNHSDIESKRLVEKSLIWDESGWGKSRERKGTNFSTCQISQTEQIMIKSKNLQVQQVLAGEIGMDTQTKFHVNGDVNIYPCGWVNEKVTTGGCRRPKGRMTIEEDGTSHFKAYRTNTGR